MAGPTYAAVSSKKDRAKADPSSSSSAYSSSSSPVEKPQMAPIKPAKSNTEKLERQSSINNEDDELL